VIFNIFFNKIVCVNFKINLADVLTQSLQKNKKMREKT